MNEVQKPNTFLLYHRQIPLELRDLRFWQRWCWRLNSSGMLRRFDREMVTDVIFNTTWTNCPVRELSSLKTWTSCAACCLHVSLANTYANHKITSLFGYLFFLVSFGVNVFLGRSQWMCGLRRVSAATRLLWLLVQIPPGTWMSLYCECCVLSGRGLCERLITSPEESYRMLCVWAWLWSLDNEEALAH